MGLDMSSSDRPMGFQPFQQILRSTMYCVVTAPTINIYHYDIVRHGGTAVTTKFGTMTAIEDGDVSDDDPALLGSVIAIFDENMDPVSYIAATEAGDSTVAGYVMVADHPEQLFIAQEDGAGNAIELAEVGLNANIVSPSLSAGDSNTGISKQEIDSSSAATSSDLNIRLLYPHLDDTVASDTSQNARWVVKINEHAYAYPTLGR